MLHEFHIDSDKRVCPTKDCGAQRNLSISDTLNFKTREIVGAVLYLECRECYAIPEKILLIHHQQLQEQQ